MKNWEKYKEVWGIDPREEYICPASKMDKAELKLMRKPIMFTATVKFTVLTI